MTRRFLPAICAAMAAFPVMAATSTPAVTFYQQVAPIIYKTARLATGLAKRDHFRSSLTRT